MKSFGIKQFLQHIDFYFSMLSRCKDTVNGRVNYIEFLENLKVDVRPGDLLGLSHQITHGSDQRENDRLGEQVIR